MDETIIKELEQVLAYATPKTRDTTLALMRAVASKNPDEAAEREHCEEAVRAWQRGEPNCHLWGMVREQRAAVRAEMQARVDAHLEQRKQQMLEADALRAELAALKAAAQRAVNALTDWNCTDDVLHSVRDELRAALKETK